ncbi:ribonuclease E/G [Putridiphycobacter roseus]|uniref:Ribonuclease E/G n=1 Tax=Putridiphycobacter roseus TaxID=2219161 RepID=A0A2W1NB73_9FLAO|nr:Rne/Rng family ribonuclease [Putridiphycobacter roseus]PZE16545.1 ribonuclease E/G [Putridiphycobacter roseus]
MNFELVVDVRANGIWIALMREGKLIELHEEKGNKDFMVGDIYLGKVRKVVPSLNAAFVDVGYEKDAFLHYLDLGPQFKSLDKYVQNTLQGRQKVADLLYFKPEADIEKSGKIDDAVTSTRQVLVQVAKEPISTKGPRLNAEITIAGRYIVLVPFSQKISISQKIKNGKERDRLRDIMRDILPKNFGVIIRTVAEDKKISEIDNDLKTLLDKWKLIHENLKTAKPPKKVLGELNRASSLLRDLLNDDFTKIHINDKELMDEMHDYISSISPGQEKILHLYTGKLNIFEHFNIHKQIKTLYGKKVPLSSGGYLIIEHTEAMHVVDVNSGNRSAKGDTQEQNALAVNMESAEELARVLRLRDMGGIICVDFIDMHKKEHNKMLFEKMKELLKTDRAKHSIIPPSKFGVMEITRQRVRPETNIETSEVCPSCEGTGKIQASIMFTDEIESALDHLILSGKYKKLTLLAHPYIASFFTNGIISKQVKWFFKYKKWISVKPVNANTFFEFSFLDKDNNKIVV